MFADDKVLAKLKAWRIQQKATQIDIAKQVGVSLATYRLWELGVGRPNYENYEKLKEVMGVK